MGFESVWARVIDADLEREARRPDDAIAYRLTEWVDQLFPTWDDLADPRLGARSIRDEPADSEAVQQLLMDQGIPLDALVYVHWRSERAGIEIPFVEFVHHYDDLWRPAEDDVWVVSIQNRRVVALSHEEFVLGADLPAPPPGVAFPPRAH